MKNIIKSRLTSLLAAYNWSILYFAQLCYEKHNLSIDTTKSICYGRIENPKIETLIIFADVLNVSLDFLVGRTNYATEELELLRNYKQCSSHGKQFVQSMATFEANYTKFENKQHCTYEVECFLPQPEQSNLDENAIVIPCLELTGSFKDGILYDTSIKNVVKTHLKNAFMALLIPNDTLANTYYKNDIVFIEKRRPNDGEIAMFHKDNYMYIRQYKREGNKHVLRSLNINTDDIVLNSNEFSQYSVVGTCIYIYRRND